MKSGLQQGNQGTGRDKAPPTERKEPADGLSPSSHVEAAQEQITFPLNFNSNPKETTFNGVADGWVAEKKTFAQEVVLEDTNSK